MDINRFTEKAREALAAAEQLAQRAGNPQLDVEHVLLALLQQEPGLAVSILRKCEIDVEGLRRRLEQEIARLPRVSGAEGGPEQVSLSGRVRRLLAKAEDETKPFRDEFVSVEHLL